MRSSRRSDSSRKKDAYERLSDELVPWDYIVATEGHLMFETMEQTMAARDGRTNPSACDISPDLSIYPPIKPPSSGVPADPLLFRNLIPTEELPSCPKGSVASTQSEHPPRVKHTYADPPRFVFSVSSELISPGIVLIPDSAVPPITLQSVREVDPLEKTTSSCAPAPSDVSQVAKPSEHLQGVLGGSDIQAAQLQPNFPPSTDMTGIYITSFDKAPCASPFDTSLPLKNFVSEALTSRYNSHKTGHHFSASRISDHTLSRCDRHILSTLSTPSLQDLPVAPQLFPPPGLIPQEQQEATQLATLPRAPHPSGPSAKRTPSFSSSLAPISLSAQVASSPATSPGALLLPDQSAAQVWSIHHASRQTSSCSPPKPPHPPVSGECLLLHQSPGDPCLPPPHEPIPPLRRSSSAASVPPHSPPPDPPLRPRQAQHTDDRILTRFRNGNEELGSARIIRNNGDWDGPNNGLFLSIQDLLYPPPTELRCRLVTHLLESEFDVQEHFVQSILFMTPEMRRLEMSHSERIGLCIDALSTDGLFPADLFISFLNKAAVDGLIPTLLKCPQDILFMAEDSSGRYAQLSAFFRYPSACPRDLSVVMCTNSCDHFVRLHPRKAVKPVLIAVVEDALREASVCEQAFGESFDELAAKLQSCSLDTDVPAGSDGQLSSSAPPIRDAMLHNGPRLGSDDGMMPRLFSHPEPPSSAPDACISAKSPALSEQASAVIESLAPHNAAPCANPGVASGMVGSQEAHAPVGIDSQQIFSGPCVEDAMPYDSPSLGTDDRRTICLCTAFGEIGPALIRDQEEFGFALGLFGYSFNNSLFVSLSDMWVWGPAQIHGSLMEHFFQSSGDTRLAWERALLHPTSTNDPWERTFLHPTSANDLTTLDKEVRCLDALWDGDRIPIDLFTSFLNANAQEGTIDRILREPCDIAIFAEDQSARRAYLISVFRYPTSEPRRLELVVCGIDGSDFSRLRPDSETLARLRASLAHPPAVLQESLDPVTPELTSPHADSMPERRLALDLCDAPPAPSLVSRPNIAQVPSMACLGPLSLAPRADASSSSSPVPQRHLPSVPPAPADSGASAPVAGPLSEQASLGPASPSLPSTPKSTLRKRAERPRPPPSPLRHEPTLFPDDISRSFSERLQSPTAEIRGDSDVWRLVCRSQTDPGKVTLHPLPAAQGISIRNSFEALARDVSQAEEDQDCRPPPHPPNFSPLPICASPRFRVRRRQRRHHTLQDYIPDFLSHAVLATPRSLDSIREESELPTQRAATDLRDLAWPPLSLSPSPASIDLSVLSSLGDSPEPAAQRAPRSSRIPADSPPSDKMRRDSRTCRRPLSPLYDQARSETATSPTPQPQPLALATTTNSPTSSDDLLFSDAANQFICTVPQTTRPSRAKRASPSRQSSQAPALVQNHSPDTHLAPDGDRPTLTQLGDIGSPGQRGESPSSASPISSSCTVADIGLSGLLSNRLCFSSCEADCEATDDDADISRTLSLPVRWQGKMYFVSLREGDCSPMARLPGRIIDSLFQSERISSDPRSRPHVVFHGCLGNSGPPTRLLGRLRQGEEPQNWFDLLWIIRRAGFVELSLSPTGGAVTGANQPSQAPSISHLSLPQVDLTQARQPLNENFRHLTNVGHRQHSRRNAPSQSSH